MPVKAKSKTKAKAKPKTKAKPTIKKAKAARGRKKKAPMQSKSKTKASASKNTDTVEREQVINRIAAPRITTGGNKKKKAKSTRSAPQYAFMKEPGDLHDFKVGRKIEVYCDHDKSKERIRGWIDGTIVQIDNKMVAVQFRSNVYLTDGWMVPDRILWYPLNSEHVRPVGGGKAPKKRRVIPDY